MNVDTSATFFELENENDNAQMAAHARLMRSLTTLPGGPVVLVACHPTKSAADDNMIPRGGGAFLAEIDRILTCISANGCRGSPSRQIPRGRLCPSQLSTGQGYGPHACR